MQKEAPGKVIITPRPPVGSGEESDIVLKSSIPCPQPLSEKSPEATPLDTSDEKAPDLGKVALDLKDKAKVVCNQAPLSDKLSK